jgi:hypothetical protein
MSSIGTGRYRGWPDRVLLGGGPLQGHDKVTKEPYRNRDKVQAPCGSPLAAMNFHEMIARYALSASFWGVKSVAWPGTLYSYGPR